MNADKRPIELTRREALEMFGMGVAAAAVPRVASAEPSFPEGAVIRTILKDYPPAELGGGATLFHEHMSLAPDFLVRFRQYAAEAQAVNRPPNAPPSTGPGRPPPDLSFMQDLDLLAEELAISKREGIASIVDGGHSDMGRAERTSMRTPCSPAALAIACVIAPMPPIAWPHTPRLPFASPSTWCRST